MRSLKPLVRKEFDALLAAPAFWLFLFFVALLTGSSFIEATSLFGAASRSAAQSPELARGLSPLDGIFVPALGGLYLASTLLYPFLAIRFISSEKESGSIKLTLQLPLALEYVIGAKAIALAVGWITAAAMPLTAVLFWTAKGGHVGGWELANLALGHALYAFAVTGISFFTAAAADSTAAAALLALAFVLGNWALDFSASTQTGWLREAAALSLSGCLHAFERGLFSSPQAAVMLIVGFAGIGSAAVQLRTGETRTLRVVKTAGVLAAGALLAAFCFQAPLHRDASEDKRNSFKAGDERALARLERPLRVRVYLNPEDSRLWDLERSVLSKLKRAAPKVRISLESAGSFIGAAGDDRYGLIVIEYGGKTGRTRSTSEEEILPIIYGLAGEKAPSGAERDYPGYPLSADFGAASAGFYMAIPALLAAGWLRFGRKTT